MPQGAAQKPQHLLKPYPGLCSRVSPWHGPRRGRQLCHQIGYRFGNSKCCPSTLFFVGASALQKFLKSEKSRKHCPWDTALGHLPRGRTLSKRPQHRSPCWQGNRLPAGWHRYKEQRSATLQTPNLLIGEGKLCALTPTRVCAQTLQGDELITTCTYNTEDRSQATVVSAGASPSPRGGLACVRTPGLGVPTERAPARTRAEAQPETRGRAVKKRTPKALLPAAGM